MAKEKAKEKVYTLKPEENEVWEREYVYAAQDLRYGPARADAYAWKKLIKEFPHIAKFDRIK